MNKDLGKTMCGFLSQVVWSRSLLPNERPAVHTEQKWPKVIYSDSFYLMILIEVKPTSEKKKNYKRNCVFQQQVNHRVVV